MEVRRTGVAAALVTLTLATAALPWPLGWGPPVPVPDVANAAIVRAVRVVSPAPRRKARAKAAAGSTIAVHPGMSRVRCAFDLPWGFPGDAVLEVASREGDTGLVTLQGIEVHRGVASWPSGRRGGGRGLLYLPGYEPVAVRWGADRAGAWCLPETVEPVLANHSVVVTAEGVVADVHVSGCGVDVDVLDEEVVIPLAELPCTLRPSLSAGVLTVRGDPILVEEDGDVVDLGLPDWEPAGIGVQLSDHPEGVSLARVYPDTPAEHEGLRAGDHIVAVDGEPVDEVRAHELPPYIIGPTGEPVTLTIVRDGEAFDVTLERDVIDP